MRWNKTSHWIIVVAVLAVLSILILKRANAVQATFTDMHMMTVMFRVESEIMQKTPAGQYYDSLFWKHSEEIAQLIEATPGKLEELIRVNRLFIPGLEALLDGRGNEVWITSEEVKEFEDELNWFVSVGSPSLREDIQRARQRLPLDHFIGMTMDEALNYINSSWTPDMIVQPTKTPIPQTAVPYSTIQIATRESQKARVQNSDGKWAYYVLNSVYFEYPAHYYYQAFEGDSKDFILIGTLDGGNPWEIRVHIWNIPPLETDKANPYFLYPAENIARERIIQTAEFEGVEFSPNYPNALATEFRAFLFNYENQLAVDIIFVYANQNVPALDDLDYAAIISQKYQYFQHMVDSLRIQKP